MDAEAERMTLKALELIFGIAMRLPDQRKPLMLAADLLLTLLAAEQEARTVTPSPSPPTTLRADRRSTTRRRRKARPGTKRPSERTKAALALFQRPEGVTRQELKEHMGWNSAPDAVQVAKRSGLRSLGRRHEERDGKLQLVYFDQDSAESDLERTANVVRMAAKKGAASGNG